MNQYKIYEIHLGTFEAVKQGWSWPAFFFVWIWAFVKKLNNIGGITLGTSIIIILILDSLPQSTNDNMAGLIAPLIAWAIPVIFGVNGNSWREKNLTTRAYTLRTIIAAESAQAAIATYIQRSR